MLYKLSRFSKVHTVLRKCGYALLELLPIRVRYRLGRVARNHRLPYRLLKHGETVVQVGAPWDLLRVGRSRSMHFSHFVGNSGHVLIVEPDPENVRRLRDHINHQNIHNVTIVPLGAWHEKGKLRFLFDPEHPAANLVESVFDASRNDRNRFKSIDIDVDSLESILRQNDIKRVRLLSLTTNGSEVPIINGLGSYLTQTDYLSVVGDNKDFGFLNELGFNYVGEDDRGYLYARDGVTI